MERAKAGRETKITDGSVACGSGHHSSRRRRILTRKNYEVNDKRSRRQIKAGKTERTGCVSLEKKNGDEWGM